MSGYIPKKVLLIGSPVFSDAANFARKLLGEYINEPVFSNNILIKKQTSYYANRDGVDSADLIRYDLKITLLPIKSYSEKAEDVAIDKDYDAIIFFCSDNIFSQADVLHVLGSLETNAKMKLIHSGKILDVMNNQFRFISKWDNGVPQSRSYFIDHVLEIL
uniref:Uncharacterized protein n=1 Tax=viral metagenome TaxID=1070528 RepID=A0A6C0C7B1_9ZZZZ